MIKKFLILNIITTSFLFISPCYAMFCCCGGEEEAEGQTITHHTQLLDPQETERRKQEVQKHKEEEEKKAEKARQLEEQALRMNILSIAAAREAEECQKQASKLKGSSSLETGREKPKDERQIITHGSITVALPKALTPMAHTDESLSLSLNTFFYMRIYKNYDAAVENNADLKALHQLNMPLKSKESLTRRMNMFYRDMREKVNLNDKPVVEDTITCIQMMVDEIPPSGPFLVKFGEAQNGSCAVLFPIKVGVILMKGPAAQEERDQK